MNGHAADQADEVVHVSGETESFDRYENISNCSSGIAGRIGKINGHANWIAIYRSIIASAAIKKVGPSVARKKIVTTTSAQPVVASAAEHRIGGTTSDKGVAEA